MTNLIARRYVKPDDDDNNGLPGEASVWYHSFDDNGNVAMPQHCAGLPGSGATTQCVCVYLFVGRAGERWKSSSTDP